MEHGCFHGCEKPLQTALRVFIVSQKASLLASPFYTNSLILREKVSFNVSKVFVFNLEILVIV